MFDNELLLERLRTVKLSFTQNELNNLVYLGLKYVCTIENPSNQYIEGVIYKIGTDRSLDNIMEVVVQSARELVGMNNIEFETGRKKKRLCEIAMEFVLMPENVRNDLGVDSEPTGSPHKN